MGRPPEPVPEDIAVALCDWIAAGKTLRSFCRQPGMPSRTTIDRWRVEDENFAGRVARARDAGFDEIADECVEIADDGSNDTMEVETRGGTKLVWNAEHVQRSKLRIESRLKLLACWDPRRYGTKVGIGQADGLAPIAATVMPVLSADQVAADLHRAAEIVETTMANRISSSSNGHNGKANGHNGHAG